MVYPHTPADVMVIVAAASLLVGAPGLSKTLLFANSPGFSFVFPPGALVRLLFNQGNGPGEEEGGGFTCRTPV